MATYSAPSVIFSPTSPAEPEESEESVFNLCGSSNRVQFLDSKSAKIENELHDGSESHAFRHGLVSLCDSAIQAHSRQKSVVVRSKAGRKRVKRQSL